MGVTMRDNKVELIKPPINTIANGEINGFEESAMGISPPMAVREVSTTGRKRNSPASPIEVSKFLPWLRSCFVKSTSRIVFFT